MSEDSQTLHHPTTKPLFSADVMTPCMLVPVWPHYQASFCYKLPYKVSLCSHTSDCWLQKSHRQRGPKIDPGGTPWNQLCLRVCTRSRGEAEKGGIIASHVSCTQPNIRLPLWKTSPLVPRSSPDLHQQQVAEIPKTRL